MNGEWIVNPETFISAAKGLITEEQATSHKVRVADAALDEAENLREVYADGQHGFGSSDFTWSLKAVLDHAGFKTDWVDHRLAVVGED